MSTLVGGLFGTARVHEHSISAGLLSCRHCLVSKLSESDHYSMILLGDCHDLSKNPCVQQCSPSSNFHIAAVHLLQDQAPLIDQGHAASPSSRCSWYPW